MNNGYIALLDSGIGGISVLLELIKELPNERFLYFGDNQNAPYGSKSKRELLSLTMKNIDAVKRYDVKLLVVACGTLSTNLLKEISEYSCLPVFGVFPPIERALLNGEKALLLATPLTADRYEQNASLKAVGLKNLAKDIELNASNLNRLNLIQSIDYSNNNLMFGEHFETIILGCTHYFFVKNKIIDHFQPQKVIDGNHFTVKMVKKYLQKSKSLGNNYRFSVLFVGKNANINKEFFEKSGQRS